MIDWKASGAGEYAKAKWAEGCAASEIARLIGVEFKLKTTRNAVIGYIHRSMGSHAVRAGLPPLPKRAPRAVVVKLPPPRPPAPVARPVAASARSGPEPAPSGPVRDFPVPGRCRWIHGEPGEQWRCCGAPVEGVTSFCSHHLARVASPTTHPINEKSFARIFR